MELSDFIEEQLNSRDPKRAKRLARRARDHTIDPTYGALRTPKKRRTHGFETGGWNRSWLQTAERLKITHANRGNQ